MSNIPVNPYPVANPPIGKLTNLYQKVVYAALIPPEIRKMAAGQNEQPAEIANASTPDELPAARVQAERSDAVRGGQAGQVVRIKQAQTFLRYDYSLNLSTSNGANLDSRSTFGEVTILREIDTIIFNGPFRSPSIGLFGIGRPIKLMLGETVYTPFADVVLPAYSRPFRLEIPRGKYVIYYGLYLTNPNVAAGYMDTLSFTTMNSGR